jgi:hypothetical protein
MSLVGIRPMHPEEWPTRGMKLIEASKASKARRVKSTSEIKERL